MVFNTSGGPYGQGATSQGDGQAGHDLASDFPWDFVVLIWECVRLMGLRGAGIAFAGSICRLRTDLMVDCVTTEWFSVLGCE